MAEKKNRKDPKIRILDIAEKAFSSHGFEGASMRTIATGAAVNLPTLYYHFGSKQGLMTAVLRRRGDPLVEEHLALLHRFEEEAAGQPLPVEKLLEAMLLPPLRLAAGTSATHAVVMRLIGRIMADPSPDTQELLMKEHREVKKIFLSAFARSCPHLPMPVLQWRCEFAWGLLNSLMLGSRRIGKETAGVCNPLDTPAVLTQMIHFLASGFRAPA